LRAIGGAAVVNRLARFCLDNCGAWVGAATQPIAAKARPTGWEPSLLAIGCAAVVNRLAHFYLKICGVWVAAAARQIATKVCSHRNRGAATICAKP
jgi:hypothetical protein